MKLLVGLGNPGAKYEHNRHNIGFMAVDEIARIHGFSSWRKRFQGECAEGVIDGEKCLLLKPTTYMNESGRAVREAANFYKIEPEDVVVFHDELDLAPGKLKVKSGGGNAGHNGLKSISAHVSNDYVRVRMGIGHPGRKDLVHIYVLQDFAKAEKQWLEPLVDAVGRSAPFLVQGDSARFLTDVAQQINPNPKNENKKAAGKGGDTKDTNTQNNTGPKAASKAEKEQTKKDGALADQLKRWRGE